MRGTFVPLSLFAGETEVMYAQAVAFVERSSYQYNKIKGR